MKTIFLSVLIFSCTFQSNSWADDEPYLSPQIRQQIEERKNSERDKVRNNYINHKLPKKLAAQKKREQAAKKQRMILEANKERQRWAAPGCVIGCEYEHSGASWSGDFYRPKVTKVMCLCHTKKVLVSLEAGYMNNISGDRVIDLSIFDDTPGTCGNESHLFSEYKKECLDLFVTANSLNWNGRQFKALVGTPEDNYGNFGVTSIVERRSQFANEGKKVDYSKYKPKPEYGNPWDNVNGLKDDYNKRVNDPKYRQQQVR